MCVKMKSKMKMEMITKRKKKICKLCAAYTSVKRHAYTYVPIIKIPHQTSFEIP